MGERPRADYAIFADTGKEKSGTLVYLQVLQEWAASNNGIPIIVIRKKNLYKDILNNCNSTNQRFVSIPAFTQSPGGSVGMLRRQCSNEYKIEQVDQEIRGILSLRRRQHTPPVTLWKGITVDEIERLSIPQERWKTAYYPFCGYRISKYSTDRVTSPIMSRQDVIAWYIKRGLPVPPKSACVFCPYQSDASWLDMKTNQPEDFAAAVEVDNRIRNGAETGIKQPSFLHRTCVPLSEINFPVDPSDLWAGECSGTCHT